MFKNLRKKKKGFTLIELIIVIAIIAILAAVALPKFGDVTKNAKVKTDQANAKTIANAATTLIAEDKITLPATEGAETTYTIGDSTVDPIEGYLQNVPTPKSETGKFFVTIDGNGTVKVFLGAKTGTQFFPAQ